MRGIPPEYQAEVDRIVARALKEQAEGFVLDGLKGELAKVWEAIDAANHFKQDFGKQLKELNDLVREHVRLPMHPGTAEELHQRDQRGQRFIQAFQIEKLTSEQRAVFPEVLETFIENRQHYQAQALKRTEWWRTTEARVGLVAALVLAYPGLSDIASGLQAAARDLVHVLMGWIG